MKSITFKWRLVSLICLLMFFNSGYRASGQTENEQYTSYLETFSDSAKIEWVKYYAGPGNSDEPSDLAVDASGNVYVTGKSRGQGGANYDIVTIKYNTAGVQQWIARYVGPSYDDTPAKIVIDAAGNVYVVGSSDGAGSGSDRVTIKYNSAGAQQWAARYNSPNNAADFGNSIAVDNNGNVYVTGSSRLSNLGAGSYYDYVTIKYNASGVQQWIAFYNSPGNDADYATDIAVDGNGNVYVTGRSKWGHYDYATVKYNASGVQQWVSRYNGSGNWTDAAIGLALDASDNVYVAGNSIGSGTDWDCATVKYNSSGVEQWAVRYSSESNYPDDLQDMTVDATGNVYITGSTNIYGNNDFITIKYSSSGTTQWTNKYNGPANYSDGAYALALDHQGNVYVLGSSQGVTLSNDLVTIKYNASGAQQWNTRYVGLLFETSVDIEVDNIGNVYVLSNSLSSNGNVFSLIKYSQSSVPVDYDEQKIITDFKLSQNYPNPFNPSTMIEFSIATASHVELKIFDLKGREIATLIDKWKQPGTYYAPFTAKGIASGRYLYRLCAGDQMLVKMMSIIK